MKRAFVLIAITALLVCVIPMVDSSDAAGETTISGYFSGGDISTSTNIYIGIVYSSDDVNGTLVGSTKTVTAVDNLGNNKFTVPIEPDADHSLNHYYIYINILGFTVTRPANDSYVLKDELSVTDPATSQVEVYKNCYRLNGADIIDDDDNMLGDSTHTFMVKSTRGTVSGKVVMNTKEPVYLTGVKVSLIDKKTGETLATDTTDNNGYNITYYTGTYDLLFELSGYDSITNEVVISETNTKLPDIMLKENQSYFGFDLSHALMILGGTAAVILLMFTIFVRIRLSKK